MLSRTKNGIANYNHSHIRILKLVNFGPQTEKSMTRVLTRPRSTFVGGHIWALRGRPP